MKTLKPEEVQYLIWQLTREGEPEAAILVAYDQNQTQLTKEDTTDE